MEDSKKEQRDKFEIIGDLLSANERFKATIAPLIQDNKKALKLLDIQSKSIAGLMENLMGTKEEHEERLKSLEIEKTDLSEIKEKVDFHGKINEQIEKRLRIIEYKPIEQVIDNLKHDKLSESDIKKIEAVLRIHPEDLELSKLKITVYVWIEKDEEGLIFLKDIISTNPKDAFLWHYKGLFSKDFDEKFKCFNTALKLIEKGSDYNPHMVLHSLANLFAKEKNYEEALKYSTKSVEASTECTTAWNQKANILFNLKRIPEALGCFEQAIKLDNNNKRAWVGKGNALSVLKPDQIEDAIICYDEAIRIDKKYARAYLNKGRLLGKHNQEKEALEVINEGLKFDDTNSCLWCFKGIAQNRLNLNDDALISIKKAIEIGSRENCGNLFENLIIIYSALGRPEKEIETYDKLIKITEPNKLSPKLLNNISFAFFKLKKRNNEGVELGKIITEKEPQNACYWDTLACNLQVIGEDKDALEAFEKALDLKESDKDITWDSLAKLYEKLGRTKDANEAYQKHEANKKT